MLWQKSIIVAVTAAALTGCSDNVRADYSACKLRAYEIFKEGIVRNDMALDYVRLCMLAAGYTVTPSCDKRIGDPLGVAHFASCFERKAWWKVWSG